jgi:hypothetical protein
MAFLYDAGNHIMEEASMENRTFSPVSLIVKTIATHTVTYSLMGLIASIFMNYAERFASPTLACWMRPLNDPLLLAAPLFQPLRGLVFALAFFPLRGVLFGKKNGWLILWWTLVALGILSTFGPPPGSIEGFIYTAVPISIQVTSWLEVVPQALLLAVILTFWVNHPEKKWMNWAMGIAFFLLAIAPPLLSLMTL